MVQDTRPFRYLNDNALWPRFHWRRLALGRDGALRLPRLPAFEGPVAPELAALDPAPPLAGVAADVDGSVYFSDPAHNTVWRIEGCFGGLERAIGIGGGLTRPSGLAIAPGRHALYIADSGSGSVRIVDLDSMALAEVLEGFGTPAALALDSEGRLYVADSGARRIELITDTGDWLPAFGDMVLASGHALDPGALACEAGLVYVLDDSTHELCVFSRDGLEEVVETGIEDARVFTVADAVLYIADPGRRRIGVWQRGQAGTYEYTGDAAGYDGPAAALATDGPLSLLASPGGAAAPLRLRMNASHATEGWLWSDAIDVDTRAHAWNRLNAEVDLPAGSHLDFYVFTGARGAPPPPPSATGAFGAPWRAVGSDVSNFYIDLAGKPAEALWLGARFGNDLHATPLLSQARLDYDQSGYMQALPAIYRPLPESGNFLQRYLGLFESFFDDLEARLDGLPALLDPAAAPAETLPWLAGWLALSLPEVQDEAAQRASIAGAFARYLRRGTVAGLREALRDEAGVRALIEEPLQTMSWWRLPAMSASCKDGAAGQWTDGANSILGLNTGLAAAEEQGAVAGSTATLDHSHLITAEEFGMPLFEAAAYRFLVRLYPGQLECAGKLEQVRAIIEREKPAHTLYEVGVIEGGLRVGFQATLGIDTLLASASAGPGRLGEGALVLGGQPRARLGMDSRVGAGAQL